MLEEGAMAMFNVAPQGPLPYYQIVDLESVSFTVWSELLRCPFPFYTSAPSGKIRQYAPARTAIISRSILA